MNKPNKFLYTISLDPIGHFVWCQQVHIKMYKIDDVVGNMNVNQNVLFMGQGLNGHFYHHYDYWVPCFQATSVVTVNNQKCINLPEPGYRSLIFKGYRYLKDTNTSRWFIGFVMCIVCMTWLNHGMMYMPFIVKIQELLIHTNLGHWCCCIKFLFTGLGTLQWAAYELTGAMYYPPDRCGHASFRLHAC